MAEIMQQVSEVLFTGKWKLHASGDLKDSLRTSAHRK
jgi:hypothetical protein